MPEQPGESKSRSGADGASSSSLSFLIAAQSCSMQVGIAPSLSRQNLLICPRTQATVTNASRILWAASGYALYHRCLDSVLGGLLHETDEVLDCPLRRAADRFQRKTPDRRH